MKLASFNLWVNIEKIKNSCVRVGEGKLFVFCYPHIVYFVASRTSKENLFCLIGVDAPAT